MPFPRDLSANHDQTELLDGQHRGSLSSHLGPGQCAVQSAQRGVAKLLVRSGPRTNMGNTGQGPAAKGRRSVVRFFHLHGKRKTNFVPGTGTRPAIPRPSLGENEPVNTSAPRFP